MTAWLDGGGPIDSLTSDDDGYPPRTLLMCASAFGHEALVDALLERKANIDVQSTSAGVSALMLATIQGHATIVRRLLKAGAQTDLRDNTNGGLTALEWAEDYGHTECVKELSADGR